MEYIYQLLINIRMVVDDPTNPIRFPRQKSPKQIPIQPLPKKKIVFGFIVLVILYLLFNSISIIEAGERGVVTFFGKPVRIIGEGLNFKTPIAESVAVIDVKTQKIETKASAASKDLQSVSGIIALNYHLAPDGVLSIVQNIGIAYQYRVIDPAIQEAVKAATAKFTAEELITKRFVVREEIKQTLSQKLNEISKSNIIVDEFDRIKIEAEQRVTQARAEADATLLQAKAQAEALRLQRVEVTPELSRFKAIE